MPKQWSILCFSASDCLQRQLTHLVIKGRRELISVTDDRNFLKLQQIVCIYEKVKVKKLKKYYILHFV